MTLIRSYSDLVTLDTFEERLSYLKLSGGVGRETFGFDRYINQRFYRSREWQLVRDQVIYRDNGCDLGVLDREIHVELLIHHMNPMSVTDIVHGEEWILNPEYLITTTLETHNIIHYGSDKPKPKVVLSRSPNDTLLWQRR